MKVTSDLVNRCMGWHNRRQSTPKGVHTWARACYVLKRRLQFMNHMNLFAILKPLKNLKALFRKSARATLQGSRDHA